MTDNRLRRTVRRGIALLLVPLFLLVIQLDIHLRKQAALVDSDLVTTSEMLAYGAIAGAIGYLLVSGVVEFYSASQ